MPALLTHTSPATSMGANLVANGATFRVWAPKATSVRVIGSFNDGTPRSQDALIATGNGHWIGFIAGVKHRDRYRYLITGPAGTGPKRDPYARELDLPFPADGIVCSTAFPWHETGFVTPAFHNLVIYQLHVGAFHAVAGPTTVGTFLDVALKVPYIAELGVTAVQLLPIQEFPTEFSLGYNGTDYFSPEMSFGVPDSALAGYLDPINVMLAARNLAPFASADLHGEMHQLKALVDLFHVHGIAVIFDVVYNHAGGDFGTESLWFFDRQTGADQHPPLWWNSCYFSDRSWAGGMVFNFEEPAVRQFLIDNALFYLDEYRVDGFRFDEVSVIDHQSYNGSGWSLCQDLTGTIRWRHPRALLHAEYWPVNPWVVKDAQDGGAGFHTTMTDGPRQAMREIIATASYPGDHALPMGALAAQLGLDYLDGRWRGVNSFENHDLVLRPNDPGDSNRMPRLAHLADPSNPHSWYARSRARVATGLLLTAPGIPMLFMGQEFLEDKPWSDAVGIFPDLRLHWEGLESGDPTMRDFLRFTRECVGLRWREPALRGEGFALVHVHDENRVIAFQRWIPGEGRDVLVVAHLGNGHRHNYRIGFPAGGFWREVFNSDVYDNWVNPQVAGNGGGVWTDHPPMHGLAFSAGLTLPANSILVFARS